MIGMYLKRMMVFTLMLVTLGAGGCAGAPQKAVSGNPPDIIKREGWTEVGKDIFVFTSDFYLANMVLVVSGSEAVLVDTGMFQKDGEKIQSFLEERKLNLKDIIITHMHADHNANLDMLGSKGISPVTPENSKDNQIVKVGGRL
jgi:glyoxylase-like metal-dependent hydrolase (beta-lactamase superfamily II)